MLCLHLLLCPLIGPLHGSRGAFLFLLPTIVELGDHLLLHDVDQALLLFQSLSSHVDVLLQELVLADGQVAVLALRLKKLPLRNRSFLPLLHLLFEFVFLGALIRIVCPILLVLILLLDDRVDHVLDATLRLVLLDFRPLHHDGVLELNAELILPQRFPICFYRRLLIVVEDVVEGQV